jgi:molybdopterin synthase catalytic subunit
VSVRWARNHDLVELDAAIADGDEIAVLPPVAGGLPRARVVSEPLDVSGILAEIESPDCGAVVSFVGTVRNNARGKVVDQITYEAYEPMATKQLDAIAVACEAQFPGARIIVVHRYGVLKVGDAAIVIGVASPHRDAAFGACREMLERIKVDVPIWKNERTEDGESWVGWGGG